MATPIGVVRDLLALVGAAAIGAAIVGAAPKPKPPQVLPVVVAREFRLVDARGRELASLHSSGDGAALSFRGPNGTTPLVVSAADGSTAVMFSGAGPGDRSALARAASGTVALSLRGKNGSLLLGVGDAAEGANLEIRDASGAPTFQAIRAK